MATVTGTFTTTGTSDAITINKRGKCYLNFGTGTVRLESRELNTTTWYPVPDGIFSSDAVVTIEELESWPVEYRLNCTAHSSNISYTFRNEP